jgi:hypothetical protein
MEQYMTTYYLVVGKRNTPRAHKLCDCSPHLEVAEHQAVEVLRELRRRGKSGRIVRVVEQETRVVQFAVHQENLDRLI